jgi:hypothetical protein
VPAKEIAAGAVVAAIFTETETSPLEVSRMNSDALVTHPKTFGTY